MYKHIIESYIIPYLQKLNYKVKKPLDAFNCPFCNTEKSAQIVPGSYGLNCHNCQPLKKIGRLYNIIDVVKISEKMEKYDDEIIYQYLREMFDIKIITKKDEEDLESYLDFYVENEFDLVPVAGNQKYPVEKEWTVKTHTDKNEWMQWLTDNLNLGVKTGKKSGITVIDIDQKEIPEEIKKVMGKTLIQETTKGYHLFYQYEEDLPKTRIDDYKIDLENDGGQVVIYPSKVEGKSRIIKELTPIIKMSSELKKLLLNKITIPRKTQSEQLKEEIATEDFKLDLLKEGARNTSLVKIGGVLRKGLNIRQTEYVLNVLNRHNTNPLPQKEVNAMLRKLEHYTKFDHEEMAHQVLDYVKQVDEASRNEIALAVVGSNRGEDKKRIDKILNYLVIEGYLLKHGTRYSVIKRLDWKENLVQIGEPVNFQMPYFYDIANFNFGDLILIGSKNKTGKCHAKGTKILMADGNIKKVENIVPQDKVMGIDSEPRNVIDICTGKEMMYEIIPNRGGESFKVNESHILSLKQVGTEKTINISVKDFLLKDKTFQRTHYLYRVPVKFKEKYIPIDPYYLGLWLGDGDSTNVRITTKDKEIIDYLTIYARHCGQQLKEYNYPNRCPSYAITHGHQGRQISTIDSLQLRMRELGILNNKHIPFDYKTNCRELRLKLLAGLIDSDGYKPKDSNSTYIIAVTIKNKRLMEDIVYLARSLGFLVNTKIKITNYKQKDNTLAKAYVITITGNICDIPVKLKRKQTKVIRQCNRNPLYTKFKIKKLKKDIYYGFTIDGDHLYMLDTFIVNHNTHISMNIVKQLVKQGIKPYYISLETGSRFSKIALQLGLKEGDFKHAFCSDPTKIELEPKAVTIIDWLLVIDKSKTDLVFRHFIEQLDKNNGILIVFQQLKEDDSYFALNMCKQFPALSTRYVYDNKDEGEFGKFIVDVVREPKIKIKTYSIPCAYNWETKELKRVDEIEMEKLNKEENEKPKEN